MKLSTSGSCSSLTWIIWVVVARATLSPINGEAIPDIGSLEKKLSASIFEIGSLKKELSKSIEGATKDFERLSLRADVEKGGQDMVIQSLKERIEGVKKELSTSIDGVMNQVSIKMNAEIMQLHRNQMVFENKIENIAREVNVIRDWTNFWGSIWKRWIFFKVFCAIVFGSTTLLL